MENSITIHHIDAETVRCLHQEANLRGISVDALVLQLIQASIRKNNDIINQEIYHDLDDLAGTWSQEEAREFSEAIAEFERIDEKLWQ
ncbi:MAG: hypothetical protein C4527_28780 [Candidatus Omnitrophota bacterium]|jgi:hypothetical protein|nr:MAG: hypothetical protein C4527_28780 [Candidatus Omnitrophota bacterium]